MRAGELAGEPNGIVEASVLWWHPKGLALLELGVYTAAGLTGSPLCGEQTA